MSLNSECAPVSRECSSSDNALFPFADFEGEEFFEVGAAENVPALLFHRGHGGGASALDQSLRPVAQSLLQGAKALDGFGDVVLQGLPLGLEEILVVSDYE